VRQYGKFLAGSFKKLENWNLAISFDPTIFGNKYFAVLFNE